MPFRDVYRRQAALLVRVLPHIAREKAFALKGGTAINLFVRDMPRLSVDIDLTYLPVQERAVSLAAIEAALRRIAAAREALIAGMVGDMPDAHRKFLLSFERGEPDWKIIGIAHVADLPAVKWRQVNLNKLASAERAALVAGLEKALSK